MSLKHLAAAAALACSACAPDLDLDPDGVVMSTEVDVGAAL
jgi:hypothetical protein